MKDRTTCPPNGWMFYQPETGWESRKAEPDTRWDFKQLVKAICIHRMKHPQFHFTIDRNLIADEVDHENALRVAGAEGADQFVIRSYDPVSFRPNGSIPKHRIIIRRTAALGDVLCAASLVSKFYEHNIGVVFQSHPSTHCILRRIPGIAGVEEPSGECTINLDGVYENDPDRTKKTFSEMFIAECNKVLSKKYIRLRATNCTPNMVVEPHEKADLRKKLEPYPRPWVMVCPRSNSWVNRTVPNDIWVEAAKTIYGTKFWLGTDASPEGFVDLNVRHFDSVLCLIANADLLVTVDTGPMHVAAALKVPIVAINQSSSPEAHISDQNDFTMISPDLECLNCQLGRCPIHPDQPPCQRVAPHVIAEAADIKLRSIDGRKVSAVVVIHQPPAERLNRCIDHLIDQVDEVVVVYDAVGKLPEGAMKHPKVRYLFKNRSDIGYGPKANYGARNAIGKYIWFVNDDCFPAPDALVKLLGVMESQPGIGMVAHELRYPDGTIQHGGTYRPPSQPGWGHLDHGARESRIKEPYECENVCGASVLLDRKAFFDARGFDEDIFLYTEDNILCLAVRQAGWRIFYTPHAKGVHEEHQSSKHNPHIGKIIQESQATLLRKWSWWFELNKHNPGLGVYK